MYENVLRRARYGMLVLSRILFYLIISFIPESAVILLAIDETLTRRYGPMTVGIGIHRDAVRSSRTNLITTPGHKWVVLSVVLRLPFMQRPLALPILSVLYTTRKQPKRNRARRMYRKHRTVGELALILLRLVRRWAPKRRFLLVADGAYGTHEFAQRLSPTSNVLGLSNFVLVSRFRMDGATYSNPPRYSGFGRPSVKGKRLDSPAEVAAKKKTRWETIRVNWYGGKRKELKICSRRGLWYKCGQGAKPIVWVLVRDPEGKRDDEVFFTTDTRLSPKKIVELYVLRWPLETTFQEAREHLGLETTRNRCALSVSRSVPMLLSLYSIIALWFAKNIKRPEKFIRSTPWYEKGNVTFSDMLFTIRQAIQQERLFLPSARSTGEFLVNPYAWIPENTRIRWKKRVA